MGIMDVVGQIQAGEQLSVSAAAYPGLRKQLSSYASFIKDSDMELFMAVVEEMKRLDLEYKTGAYQENKWFDCLYEDDYFSVMVIPGGLYGLAMRRVFVTIHFVAHEWETLREAIKALEGHRLEAHGDGGFSGVKVEIPNRGLSVDLGRDAYFAFLELLEVCAIGYLQQQYEKLLKARFEQRNPLQVI